MSTINEVLTPDRPHPTSPAHRANGKFAPGNAAGVGFGRKRRAEEAAIIAAMDAALPAEELQQLLTDAIGWAREYKSPKLALSIAQFVVSYQIGSPIQRSMSASTKLETILAKVGSMDEEEFAQVEQAMRGE